MSSLTLRTACALLVLVAPLSLASEPAAPPQAQPDALHSAGTPALESATSAPSAQQVAHPVAQPAAQPVVVPVATPAGAPVAQSAVQPGAQPAVQPAQATAKPGTQPVAAIDRNDPERVICRRIDALGSRIRRERVCKTQKDWAAADLQKKEVFRSIDRGSAGAGTDPKMGGG